MLLPDGVAVAEQTVGADALAAEQARRLAQPHGQAVVGVRGRVQAVAFHEKLIVLLGSGSARRVPVPPGVLVHPGGPGCGTEGTLQQGLLAAGPRSAPRQGAGIQASRPATTANANALPCIIDELPDRVEAWTMTLCQEVLLCQF